MPTWGDFMAEMPVRKMNPGGMMVPVDEVIALWEERNQLREKVVQEREACAREVEEFADAVAAEAEPPEQLVAALRAAATLIRERTEVVEEAAAEEPPPTIEPMPDQAD